MRRAHVVRWRRHWLPWLISGCLAVSGCGGGEASQEGAADVTSSDLGSGQDDAQTEDGAAGAGDTAGDAAPSPSDGASSPSETAGADTWAPTCPGGIGCPCSGDQECAAGPCLATPQGKQCSAGCGPGCPPGWKCAEGQEAICVPRLGHLCDPCQSSKQCQGPGHAGDRCVPRGPLGSFCGLACKGTDDCPAGMICAQVSSTEGEESQQCVSAYVPGEPFAVCACSPWAVAQKLETACSVDHKGASGTVLASCPGVRSCASGSLSACDAAPIGPEGCDGLDNDCDGVTDEGTCDDANGCTSDKCDAIGGKCLHVAFDGLPCNADGSFCTKGDACKDGACVAGTDTPCQDGNPCTTDGCEPSKGCVHLPNLATCDADNDVCTVADTCAGGLCLPGQSTVCDDSNPCTDDTCHTLDGCVFTPNSAPCDADGSLCTVQDHCEKGACLPGAAKSCDDLNPCTADDCDAGMGCINVMQDGPCDADANGCTVGDKCQGGVCLPGAVTVCDDGNPCTADSCQVKDGSCVFDGAPKGASPCDADGSACTVGDACKGGLCLPGAATGCDDDNPCTDDACDKQTGCSHAPNVKPCDADGDPCTASDACKDGACLPGKPDDCDDGNDCTTDSCVPKKGCAHQANDGFCDDGDGTTQGDWCDAGKCMAGKKLDCDDKNPCTTDVPDASGKCVFKPHSSACDDGNACTVGDACAAAKCVPGGPKACDDGTPCTQDGCDPKTGCTHVATAGPCDDGDMCSGPDACEGGKCVAGANKSCDDGNACSADSCESASGCKHTPQAGQCDDGDPCTGPDGCQSGACKGGPVAACDDQNPCTDDVCKPGLGCTFPANTKPCDDGEPCTKPDTCAGGKCVPGAPDTCDDGNDCTVDSCVTGKGCTSTTIPPVACDGTVWSGRCYKAFKSAQVWANAEKACVAWGGHLSSIASSAENDQVYGLAKKTCGSVDTWIGLTDQVKENTWVWTDGAPLTYTNWNGGEPNDYKGGEDWVHLTSTGKWNDHNSGYKPPCYVCERKSLPTCAGGTGLCVGGACQKGG